jgi:hypothetical protein
MAIDPIVAQAILSNRTPNLVGQFFAGQEAAQRSKSLAREEEAKIAESQRQEQARGLTGRVARQAFGTGELGELAGVDPNAAAQLAQAAGIPIGQEARLQSFAKDIRIAKTLAEQNPEKSLEFLIQRRNKLNSLGIETPTINGLIDMIGQDPKQLLPNLEVADRAFVKSGVIEQPGAASKRSFAPITLVNPKTKEKRLVSPTVDPKTGQATLEEFQIPEGFQVSKETAEEKRAADVVAAGEKKTAEEEAKKREAREQGFIDRGIAAADSTANVRRSIALLDEVETGGIDAVATRIRSIFGVEGADEGELSANLGKAVLSQLRETFGAQFTAAEGERLERIEAGFGRSPATNKRLLNNVLTLMERLAKRGMSAAEDRRDDFAIQQIEDALKFELNDEPAEPDKPKSVGRFQIQVVK